MELNNSISSEGISDKYRFHQQETVIIIITTFIQIYTGGITVATNRLYYIIMNLTQIYTDWIIITRNSSILQ